MQNTQPWARRALWTAALLTGTVAAHAQFRASLTGTVTDPTGAVIPGAQVMLKDNQTGKVLTSTSNSEGFYTFNALPPDNFTLTTKIAGFKTSTISNLTITPEQANNTNVQLQLGTADTTVDVSADTLPTLDTATASLSNTITSNQIQSLPSAGRDVFQLAQLAPGAFGDGQQGAGGGTNSLPGTQGPGGPGAGGAIFATENGPQTLSGGGQYETNSISIDGISTVSAVWGGTSVITPNEDSVDNVSITTNGYDAEFGRFSGANMQVTTKAGTNQVHGSFFFRVDRPGLNAYQRYNGPASLVAGTPLSRNLKRDSSRYNDIGGSIGGPILKDKLFAFFAYDTVRNNGLTLNDGWYETTAFDAAAPSGYISNTYNNFAGHRPVNTTLINETCATAGLREGVNCRTVTGQGLDIGSPLTTGKGRQDLTYVSTSQPGVGSGLDGVADVAHYSTPTSNVLTETQYNGRMDWNATQKDHVAFAIYWVPLSNHFYNDTQRGYNAWNHNQINDAFSLIYNHTFSPTLLNEARANAAGWRWNEVTDNPQEPFGLPTDTIAATGGFTAKDFGAAGPSHLNQWTYGYKDVLTKVYKTHTMKFGAEATQLHYLQDPVYAARPSFSFYNVWDFLNDAPYAESGTFNRFTGVPFSNRYDMRQVIWGGFAQDDWKVTPNLTINYGLRYNYFNALYSKQNNLPHVNFGQGAALFTGIQLIRGGYEWSPQANNLGPQLGFAWNPDYLNKKLVIRGGYGINYNQEEIAISANTSYNPNDSVQANFSYNAGPTSIDPRIQYSTASSTNSLFGYPANANTITSYNANGLPANGGFNLTSVPNNFHTQQVHHYSLQAEYEMPFQMVASASYQGSVAHHLIFHQNLYLYGLYHGAAFNPLVPYVEHYGDSGGSNYNALILDLKHNMAHNFSIDASYTYAKSMDDASGPYSEDPYPYNPVYARGRSDFNFGQALKIYGVYQPKVYYGSNRLARTMLNGFSVSGIYNLHSGFPWTPVSNLGQDAYYNASGNFGSSGYSTLRPGTYYRKAGQDHSNLAYYQTAAGPSSDFQGGGLSYFTVPTTRPTTYPTPPVFYPTPGIARNSFTGPKYQDVDATVVKTFGLPHLRFVGEQAGIQFRADAFNLFNQTNLNIGSISNDISNPNFGVIQNALGSRTVELQARFNF